MNTLRLKTLTITAITILVTMFMPISVYAQDPNCENENLKQTEYCINQSPGDNPFIGPDGILTAATELLSTLVGVASVIVIVVAGLLYTISAGDPSRANKARSAIIYALVGLVIAIMARTIVIWFLKRF